MLFTDLYRDMIIVCKERTRECVRLNPNAPICKYESFCSRLQQFPADVDIEDLQKEMLKVTGEQVYTKIDGTVIRA
jgi:hypothetical protein